MFAAGTALESVRKLFLLWQELDKCTDGHFN